MRRSLQAVLSADSVSSELTSGVFYGGAPSLDPEGLDSTSCACPVDVRHCTVCPGKMTYHGVAVGVVGVMGR